MQIDLGKMIVSEVKENVFKLCRILGFDAKPTATIYENDLERILGIWQNENDFCEEKFRKIKIATKSGAICILEHNLYLELTEVAPNGEIPTNQFKKDRDSLGLILETRERKEIVSNLKKEGFLMTTRTIDTDDKKEERYFGIIIKK